MKLTKYLAAAAAVGIASSVAWGAGIFQTYPVLGGAAYCAAANVSGASQGTVTGQGGAVPAAGTTTGTVICQVAQPAGPAVYAGTEVVPMDIYPPGTAQLAGGQQTALNNIMQLGNGPIVDNNVAGAAQTIPNNTSWFVLDTNTPTTVAITMPAAAIEGQVVHLVCGIAISVALSVVANTGQTIKNQPASTCTAGQGFAWRFSAAVPNNISGAAGAIAANSWVRIY